MISVLKGLTWTAFMSEAKSTSPLESIEEFFLYELPEVRGTWHALCNALARLLKRLNPTERSHGGTLHLSRVIQWMVGPSASVQDRSICPSSINEHSQRRAGENRQKFVRVDTLSLDSSAGAAWTHSPAMGDRTSNRSHYPLIE